MLKELLFKLFGKSESPPWRAAEQERSNSAKSLPAEQQAVTLYIATTASGTLMKRYVAKQLQRRPVLNQAADENALSTAAGIAHDGEPGSNAVDCSMQDNEENNLGYCQNPEAVRWLVMIAEDPATDRDLLEQLSHHEIPDVRIAVTDNPMISLRVLGQLVRDENPDVRFAIAENHQMPVQLLEVLAEDDNPYVAHRARRTLSRINSSGILKNQFPFKGDSWRQQRKA